MSYFNFSAKLLHFLKGIIFSIMIAEFLDYFLEGYSRWGCLTLITFFLAHYYFFVVKNNDISVGLFFVSWCLMLCVSVINIYGETFVTPCQIFCSERFKSFVFYLLYFALANVPLTVCFVKKSLLVSCKIIILGLFFLILDILILYCLILYLFTTYTYD